jgi:hypothetical protein
MLVLSVSAHASTIVADGGFEAAGGGNSYSAGSSIDGGSWTVTLGQVYIDTTDPWVFDGNNSANLTYDNLYAENSLSQTISTIAGDQYTVYFWANADSSNTFSVTENGLAIAGTPSSIVDNGFPNATNSSLFVEYSGTFGATSSSTNLTFTSEANPALLSPDGSVMIDDVSVAQTPEPSSVLLMLSGMIALGLLVARKRGNGAASPLSLS